jgi:folate-binding protein YgfZ
MDQNQRQQMASTSPTPWHLNPFKSAWFSELNSNHAVLSISGPDAATFLQGQITCQVTDIHQGVSHIGAHCNPQGRVQSLFRLLPGKDHQEFLLILPHNMLTSCVAAMRPYVLRSQVQFEDVSHDHTLIGVHCPATDPQHDHLPWPPKTDYWTKHHHLTICCVNATAGLYLVGGPTEACIADFPESWRNAPDSLWQHACWNCHIPRIQPSSRNQYTPHMLNLPALDAVCLSKGCFCGQEVIARTTYRGQNKRHFSVWSCTDSQHEPSIGDVCYQNNQAIGHVLDVISTSTNPLVSCILKNVDFKQLIYFDEEGQHAGTHHPPLASATKET